MKKPICKNLRTNKNKNFKFTIKFLMTLDRSYIGYLGFLRIDFLKSVLMYSKGAICLSRLLFTIGLFTVRWETSTLENSHSNILLIAIWNIYIWACDRWRMLATWLPQCMCYMNIHERTWTALVCTLSSTCKASANHLLAAKTPALVTTMKRLDQGHLHPKLEVPGLTCPGWESKPGLQGKRRAL